MKNINVLNGQKATRNLVLSSIGIVSMFALVFVSTASAATITRSLDLGSTGADVSTLQTYLATDSNIYPSGLVTGYYGQLTKAAVERFQTARGIVTSGTPATTGYGRVGPQTRAALNQAMASGVVVNTGDSAPSINSVNVSTTNNSATIGWNTNENASAVVYYSTSPLSMTEASPTTGVIIGGSSVLANTDMRSSHSVIIPSLNSNTTYYYVLYVRDVNGNESISWPETFRTN